MNTRYNIINTIYRLDGQEAIGYLCKTASGLTFLQNFQLASAEMLSFEEAEDFKEVIIYLNSNYPEYKHFLNYVDEANSYEILRIENALLDSNYGHLSYFGQLIEEE